MSTHRRGWRPRAPHRLWITLALLACADSPQAPVASAPATDTQAPLLTASLANKRVTSPGAILVTVASNEPLVRVEVARDDGHLYYAESAMLEEMRDASASGFTYKFLQPAADGGNGTRTFVVWGFDLAKNITKANAGSVVIDNRWQTLRAIDAVGNVHLGTDGIGNVVTAADHSSRDVVLVKVDAAGKELWTRTFGGADLEILQSLSVSPLGQIVIAGMLITGIGVPSRCFVASFTADGTPGIVLRLDDRACVAAAVDAAGSVFVLGYSQATSEQPGCEFLVKLSSTGTPIWRREFRSAGGSSSTCDEIGGIAVDPEGNAYVTGYTREGGTFDAAPPRGVRDAFVIKYDAAGNQLWARQFGYAGKSVQVAPASSIDPDGGVVFAATVFEPTCDQGDALVVRYDASGTLLWSRRFANGTDDRGRAVAADRRGVYVVGYVLPGDVSGDFKEERQGRDGFLAFLSRSGEVQSVRLLGNGGPGGMSGVALAKSGDIVTTGWLDGSVLLRHPVVP